MKYLLSKDNYRRHRFKVKESDYRVVLGLARNQRVLPSERFTLQKSLRFLFFQYSPIRIRNRCLITGRGNSTTRFFRLTRMKLRQLAAENKLAGVKVSSW